MTVHLSIQRGYEDKDKTIHSKESRGRFLGTSSQDIDQLFKYKLHIQP